MPPGFPAGGGFGSCAEATLSKGLAQWRPLGLTPPRAARVAICQRPITFQAAAGGCRPFQEGSSLSTGDRQRHQRWLKLASGTARQGQQGAPFCEQLGGHPAFPAPRRPRVPHGGQGGPGAGTALPAGRESVGLDRLSQPLHQGAGAPAWRPLGAATTPSRGGIERFGLRVDVGRNSSKCPSIGVQVGGGHRERAGQPGRRCIEVCRAGFPAPRFSRVVVV